MDNIILGMLMMKNLTIYEIRLFIKENFNSMCSDSMGSIQATIKKLLLQKKVTFYEVVEGGVNKKKYKITKCGQEAFEGWVQTAMVSGKNKNMELSKLFFMGFVPQQKRLLLMEDYIKELKKEKEQLDDIKKTTKLIYEDNRTHMLNLNENAPELKKSLDAHGSILEQKELKDIVEFQLLTLQFGIDNIEFEIQWYERLREKFL